MSNPTGSRGCSQRLRFDAMDLTRQAPVLPWLKAEVMSDPLVGQRTNPHCPPGTSPDSLCSDHSSSNCSRFAMSKTRPWKRLPRPGADVEGDNGVETRALHAFLVHFQRRRSPLRGLPVDEQWQSQSHRILERSTERVSSSYRIDR